MLWPILGSIFFLTMILSIFLLLFWKRSSRTILVISAVWYITYAIFIIFFTGAPDLSIYPPEASSPYKLPWKAGIERFVAQGNRSFTSHRGSHLYAWDFVMLNGTEILAARAGRVVEVTDHFDWIGLNSNVLLIEHEDGERSGYAHIRYKSSLVKVGDLVKQGQPIALSGMVGQTIFPHVHFYVLGKTGLSIPITFSDVPGGIPLAGHFYTSTNDLK